MLLSLRKNGLDSLFKDVRVFKELRAKNLTAARLFHRKPQIFAGNRRKPQIFAETGFSHLLSPFWRTPIYCRDILVSLRGLLFSGS